LANIGWSRRRQELASWRGIIEAGSKCSGCAVHPVLLRVRGGRYAGTPQYSTWEVWARSLGLWRAPQLVAAGLAGAPGRARCLVRAMSAAQVGAGRYHAPSGFMQPGRFGTPHRRAVKLPPIRIDLAVAERDRLVARQPSSARGRAPLDTPRPARHPQSPAAMEYNGGCLSPRAPRAPRAPYASPSARVAARRATERRQPHRSAARQIRVPAPAAARPAALGTDH
jgi:hypothetical protein